MANTLLPEYAQDNESAKSDFYDKTFAIDFEKGRIVGMIDGFSALLQSIELMLGTPRFKHDEVVLFATEYITSALKSDDRVKDVYDFEFEKNRDGVQINFKISTVYGETERGLTVKND